MSENREKLDACTTEEELLAAVDAILLAHWDGVSEPTLEQYRGGRIRGGRDSTSTIFDVIEGRRSMGIIDILKGSGDGTGVNKDFQDLTSFLTAHGVQFVEAPFDGCRTFDDCGSRSSKFATLYLTKSEPAQLRVRLFQRLEKEMEVFVKVLRNSNQAPEKWLNRWLQHSRLGLLLDYEVNDVLFFVHRIATSCPTDDSVHCKHGVASGGDDDGEVH